MGVVPRAFSSPAAFSSTASCVGVWAVLIAGFPPSTSLFFAASASLAALRPMLSFRRSFVLKDLATVSALSIAFFVACISFRTKARLSALYLV